MNRITSPLIDLHLDKSVHSLPVYYIVQAPIYPTVSFNILTSFLPVLPYLDNRSFQFLVLLSSSVISSPNNRNFRLPLSRSNQPRVARKPKAHKQQKKGLCLAYVLPLFFFVKGKMLVDKTMNFSTTSPLRPHFYLTPSLSRFLACWVILSDTSLNALPHLHTNFGRRGVAVFLA